MSALEEARAQGMKVGMFRPITVWPFPEKQLKEVAKKVSKILVVEHNYGQMLLEVQRIVEGRVPVDFLGKIDGTTITPTDVIDKVKEVY